MDALQALLTRRSVRQFTDQPISEDDLETILRAAMMAPSAGNQQSWQFVLITDREVLNHVPTYSPNASMASQAQAAILICGDLSKEAHKGFWVQDCSAALENLLLAAHALGLGAVWTGIYPGERHVAAFRKEFGLPVNIIPLAFIPIGYPAVIPPTTDRYDIERIHKNRW